MGLTDPSSLVIVCDAGPIIHLDELGCLDLLSDFSRVLVPESVWQEVVRHRPGALATRKSTFARVTPKTKIGEPLIAAARLFALHAGEFQALHIAIEYDSDMLLTDDSAARLAAGQLAIPVHGTLGILLRSIRRGSRTAHEVERILQTLPQLSTLHVKDSLLAEILKELRSS